MSIFRDFKEKTPFKNNLIETRDMVQERERAIEREKERSRERERESNRACLQITASERLT